ncbi:hypothetical protein [Mycolicibacterium palauense]|uniref:hypothetical protein n=1 Tax=Mycolicibacterium palauense TaxID=2034511 RepID=UPI000BFEDB91|nr:hypothetical protein [Mycolicibacterium palauense]
MSTIATKIKAGAAAGALAGAAALASVPVAQAETFATGLGVGAGDTVAADCGSATAAAASEDCLVEETSSSSSSLLPGGYTLLQNKLLWWGPTAEVTPALTPILQVKILNFVPSIFGLKNAFGWVEDIDYTSCVAGATARIGSYGTLTIGISKGCAV